MRHGQARRRRGTGPSGRLAARRPGQPERPAAFVLRVGGLLGRGARRFPWRRKGLEGLELMRATARERTESPRRVRHHTPGFNTTAGIQAEACVRFSPGGWRRLGCGALCE